MQKYFNMLTDLAVVGMVLSVIGGVATAAFAGWLVYRFFF